MPPQCAVCGEHTLCDHKLAAAVGDDVLKANLERGVGYPSSAQVATMDVSTHSFVVYFDPYFCANVTGVAPRPK